MVARTTGEVGPRKPSLGSRANRSWLPCDRLARATPPHPRVASRRASAYGDSHEDRRPGCHPFTLLPELEPCPLHAQTQAPLLRGVVHSGAEKSDMGWSRASEVPIGKTATSADWHAGRGAACVATAQPSYGPPMQAAPSRESPCRFFRDPPCTCERSETRFLPCCTSESPCVPHPRVTERWVSTYLRAPVTRPAIRSAECASPAR